MSLNKMNNNNGFEFSTIKEIKGQPELWAKLWSDFQLINEELRDYLKNIFNNNQIQIILTGAGTSAFIGDVLLGVFNKNISNHIKAVPTTDLVTHPQLYLNKNKEYLLVSFARSGNSPESSQVIYLAEKFSKKVHHLIITCNKNSELTKIVSNKDHYIFLMPPDADDKGLAMTGSFTTMLLAGLLCAKINSDENLDSQVTILCKYGHRIISDYFEALQKTAELDFCRAVFLGSGLLKGTAEESHLKLQELTDGKVICKFDSFMGFRHGPKAVVDENTLVVYLFSNNKHVNLYEVDLVNSISAGRKNLYTVGVSEEKIEVTGIDLQIVLSENDRQLQEDFLAIVSVLPSQLLGYFKSLKLGLNPDSPSDSGMIHRVVQGVNIYPYETM